MLFTGAGAGEAEEEEEAEEDVDEEEEEEEKEDEEEEKEEKPLSWRKNGRPRTRKKVAGKPLVLQGLRAGHLLMPLSFRWKVIN